MDPRSMHALGLATRTLMWGGFLSTMAGVLVFVAGEAYGRYALGAIIVGLVGLVASTATSHPLDTLPDRHARRRGETAERLRTWTRLRAASLTIHSLAFGAIVVVVLSMLLRNGIVQADLEPQVLDRGATVLVGAMAAANLLAHRYSLRFRIERDRSGMRTALFVMAVVLGLIIAARAALIEWSPAVGGRTDGEATAMVVVLAGHVVAAYALTASRSLPTLSILLSKEASHGHRSADPTRQAFLPAVIAFSLLLVVFLLFVLLGVGIEDVITRVSTSPFVLGALVFLLVAIVASVAASLALARSQERGQPLWHAPRNPKERVRATILAAGLVGGGLLMAIALVVWNGGVLAVPSSAWVHFFCLGLLLAVGPYGFYMASEHKRIRLLEERFPDLLRDLSSSHKGGLTLAEAVAASARGDYGPLTPEIRKMADQISWNVPFAEALVRFGDRVQTPLVERAVNLILEANRSGGSTTDVLIAAARDAREIKNLENERRLSMSLYTIVIYITFFVFLSVAAVLYAQFVPSMVAASEAAAASTLPSGGVAGIGGASLRIEDFQLFYFMAAVMQGLGNGFVAGVMGTGKAVLGLRHAFLMVLFSYLTFTLFLV